MKTLHGTKKKIEQTSDLNNIVKTMKNIATVNISLFEKKVQAARESFRTIEDGFQILLHKEPSLYAKIEKENLSLEKKLFGAIIFGSEKALCGEFNERILTFFKNHLAQKGEVNIIAIGQKIATSLHNYQIKSFEYPSTHEETTELLWRLLELIQNWLEKENVGQVSLYYNHLMSGLSYKPIAIPIFPLNLDWLKSLKENPWESSCLPTIFSPIEEIFYDLVNELLYISLYQGFVESLASENAGRLSAMQSAEENIEEHLDNLQKEYHQLRQTQITEEIFDIVSGFIALKRPELE